MDETGRTDAMPQFDYTVRTAKSVDEATAAVEAALTARNFRVQMVHDVQATLAEKGFEREPIRIVETCNAKYAYQVLEADVSIALMLPCPIAVYDKDGETFISSLKPSAIGSFYPHAGIDDVAQEVEGILLAAVDEAAR